MNKYRVYSKDGRVERCRLTKVEYSGTFMGDRVVTSSFISATEIAFDVFDYIEFRGEKFELEMIPTVKKVSSYQYEYDLRFVSLKYELERCMFRDFVPNDNEVVYPTPVTVEFTGKVNYLTERIQACLDRMYGAGVWSIVVSEGVDSEEKNLSLSNQNCWNALSLVNTEYKLNFHINGRTVVVGDSEAVQGVVFEYGKGNGLYEIERAADSDTGIVTKLIAYGGTRNLDYSYPKKPEWSDSVLPNTFILSPLRLMLPSFKKDGKTDYLLADDALIAKYGIREGVMMYDDIYPTITGATNSKGERIDKIAGVDAITDEETSEFDVYLNDLGFDLNDSLTTETPQLVMKTGALQGYAFNIKTIGALSNGGVRVTLEKNSIDNSDTGGYYIPNKDFNMSAGDEFVLLGILMPQLYIRNAEQRLEERAREYLNQYSTTNYSYSIGVDEIFMAKNPSVMAEVFEGKKMKINDDEIGINEELVTIQSLTIEDGDGLIPRIKVTLNNNPSASTLERIQGQIANIESTANSQYSAQTELAKQYQRKLNTSYFHRLFVAIDANGNEIAPNDTTTPIASVRVNYGLWTEQFLSAKGMNSGGGSDEPTGGATTLGGLRNVAADADRTYDVAKMLVLEAKSNLWSLKNLSELVGGLDEAELAEYLTNNNYAKKGDIPSLDGYATEQWVLGKGYLTEHQDLSAYAKKTDIPTIPTKVSAFENDANYATTSDLDSRIDALVNGAPAAYDTLKEIADVLANNINSIDDILTALGTKVSKDDFNTDIANVNSSISALNTELSGKIDLKLDAVTFNELFEKVQLEDGTWAIKAKLGLFSDGFISAKGSNVGGTSSEGGAVALYQLNDVLADGTGVSGAQHGAVFVYDATIGKWKGVAQSEIVPNLTGYAKESWVLQQGFLTEHQDLSDYAKLTDIPTIPTTDINKGVTAYGWGDHSKVGYLTSHQSLDGYVNEIATSGNGNAITSVSKNGKKITFTKGATYLTGITSKLVTDALGFTPFDEDSFTKANIKSTLGISDWALAATKPSYTTKEVAEDTNLYFTNARAVAALKSITDGLSSSITSNTTKITNLTTKVDDHIAVFNSMFKLVELSDGTMSIQALHGLWSDGFISAKGANSSGGSSSGGGLITSLYRYADLGKTFADTNNDTFNAYTINKINTDLGSRISVLEGKATNVSFTQSLTNGTQIGTITIDGASKTIYAPTIPSSLKNPNALTINNSAGTAQVSYDGSAVKSLTLTKAMVGLGNVENTALSTWVGTNKITTLGTITTGVWNGTKIANGYLANSAITIAGTSVSLGGSITAATLQSNLGLGTFAYKSSLAFADLTNKPTTLSGFGITDAYTKSQVDSALGGYLPLSGGTIEIITDEGLSVNRTNGTRALISFKVDGGYKGGLGIDTDGVPLYRTYAGGINTLIHSGNYTDYTYSQSTIDTKLGGYLPLSGGTLSAWGNPLTIERTDGASPSIGFLGVSGAIGAIGVDYNNEPFFYRSSNKTTYFLIHAGNIGSQSVASAEKLTTARSIWGQSFDGTGDVSGTLSNVGNIYFGANNTYNIGSNTNQVLYIYTKWIGSQTNSTFAIGAANAYHLNILTNGNVGIGTTSPQYKLDVNGALNAGVYYASITNSIGKNTSGHFRWGKFDEVGGLKLQFGAESGANLAIINSAWNKALFVVDTEGNVTASGTIHSNIGIFSDGYVSAKGQNTSSDMRLKNVLNDVVLGVNDIANAPSMRFSWKNGGGVDVGSSAQYWQGLLPDAVKERDGMLEMQYANIALLSAISLAKNFETMDERVARLEKENKELRNEINSLRYGA